MSNLLDIYKSISKIQFDFITMLSKNPSKTFTRDELSGDNGYLTKLKHKILILKDKLSLLDTNLHKNMLKRVINLEKFLENDTFKYDKSYILENKNVNNSFDLLTFNVFQNRCYKKITDIENQLDCDIICTQEEPHNTNSLFPIKFKNYERIYTCGNKNEVVGVYYNKKIKEIPKLIKCIDTISDIKGIADRAAIIFEYKGYTIANIHLEGGRYSDEILSSNLKFKSILKYKMKLLEEVVEENPDIIVGDFNSIYVSKKYNMESVLQGQYKYFADKHFYDKVKIREWNESPYLFLQDKGYFYNVPENEDIMFTNIRGKTIIDTIWCKKNVKKGKTEILDLIGYDFNEKHCIVSDHNPVKSTFYSF